MQLDALFPGKPLLAKVSLACWCAHYARRLLIPVFARNVCRCLQPLQIDATNNRPISVKYRVMSYPTLLLFTQGVDGEVYEDRNMAVLKGTMAGLVQVRPEKQTRALTAHSMHLSTLDVDLRTLHVSKPKERFTPRRPQRRQR